MTTTMERENLLQEFRETIAQIGPEFLEEQTTQSPSHLHRNHLRSHRPKQYAQYLTMGILWEACLAAQARYEMERQTLLDQGLTLQEAKEIALRSHILVPSEEDLQEETKLVAEMESLEAEYRGTDLTTILATLNRQHPQS